VCGTEQLKATFWYYTFRKLGKQIICFCGNIANISGFIELQQITVLSIVKRLKYPNGEYTSSPTQKIIRNIV